MQPRSQLVSQSTTIIQTKTLIIHVISCHYCFLPWCISKKQKQQKNNIHNPSSPFWLAHLVGMLFACFYTDNLSSKAQLGISILLYLSSHFPSHVHMFWKAYLSRMRLLWQRIEMKDSISILFRILIIPPCFLAV